LISRWLNRRELQKQLKECNYEMAKTVVIRKFSGGVIPNELAALLDTFIPSPCIDTAVELIEYAPKFFAFFEL
jgi:hypothetical protein